VDDPYTTLYRWQWFQREQWRKDFRQRKSHSPRAFRQILGGSASRTALDCSAGLGLKTLCIRELGVRVWGSDACAFAVEKARELARLEGLDIEYFVSTWADLPGNTDRRFDGVFNDALCFLETDEEFEASIRGIRGVLAPGGVFVWAGAAEGDPAGKGAELIREKFESLGRFSLNWTHAGGGVECTSITVRELGGDYMDEHLLFVVSGAGGKRLETATIRWPAWWDFPRARRLFEAAGYSDLRTETFEGMGAGGKTFRLNVAVR